MPRLIQRGDSGAVVRELQGLLKAAGHDISVDGMFGANTEYIVKAFQTIQGLTPDGVVGTRTWESLYSVGSGVPGRGLELPIDFARVADLFPQLMKQKYRLSDAQCPSNPPGMTLRNIGDEWTNCVQFTAWLLSNAFAGVRFNKEQWRRWMVSGDYEGNPPIVPNWGPRVILEWGCGSTAPGKGAYLVQYFTRRGGHSLIVVDYDPESDRMLTLEAIGGLEGAGWYGLGALRDVPNPGLQWAKKVRQTWSGRFDDKVAVHMVKLAIDPESIQRWLAEGPL